MEACHMGTEKKFPSVQMVATMMLRRMRSLQASKENEEDEFVIVTHERHAPTTERLPLTIVKEMEKMLFRLSFDQIVAQKLVGDISFNFIANTFIKNVFLLFILTFRITNCIIIIIILVIWGNHFDLFFII